MSDLTVLKYIRALRVDGKFDEIDKYIEEIAKGDYSSRVKFGMWFATAMFSSKLPNRSKLRQYIVDSILEEEPDAERIVDRYLHEAVDWNKNPFNTERK